MLIYYADLAEVNRPVEQFWSRFGRTVFDAYKPELRLTNPIRSAATEATRNATTVDGKIDALLRLVRERIKRTDVDGGGAASNRKANKDAAETLARGAGDSRDVTTLFVTLAAAAGLEAKLALVPDRTTFLSGPGMRQPYFLDHLAVAVRAGESWRFVDAGHDPAAGRLAWWHEGQYALLLDEKNPLIVAVALSAPAVSATRRAGTLTLQDDGTLAGNLSFEYSGHVADRLRDRHRDETPAERERLFKESLEMDAAGLELSGFAVENLDTLEQPYRVKFTVRIPGYAQRAGSRLFLQPSLFQRSREARFTAPTRQHQIYFPYAWTEEDTLTFRLPDGWEVEPDAGPKGMGLDGGATAAYSRSVSAPGQDRTVTYSRSLMVGGQGRLFFPRDVYLGIKAFFDTVHQGDRSTLTLRRPEAPASSR
jgi:hypothetical protein